MSDPMSSHEIEDVLSSIRRLVSEDLRPGAVRTRIPVETDAQKAEARLILTPALRVIRQAAARTAGSGDAQADDWDFEALTPEVLGPPLADKADPVPGSGAEPKPGPGLGTEDLRNDRLRAAATIAFPRASAAAPHLFQSRRSETSLGPEEEDELEQAALSSPRHDPDADTDIMIWDDAAFDEAALMARRPDLLMDAEEEPAPAAEAPMPLSGEIIEATPAAPMWSDAPEQGRAWNEVEQGWEEDVEEAYASTARPIPLRPGLTENPLARAWADRLEETLRAELQAEFKDPVDAEVAHQPVSELAFSEDATFEPEAVTHAEEEAPVPPRAEVEAEVARELGRIDEDLLRELVREVLQEELAGALGERITRNVRKLVRMEINRSLSTGDFQ